MWSDDLRPLGPEAVPRLNPAPPSGAAAGAGQPVRWTTLWADGSDRRDAGGSSLPAGSGGEPPAPAPSAPSSLRVPPVPPETEEGAGPHVEVGAGAAAAPDGSPASVPRPVPPQAGAAPWGGGRWQQAAAGFAAAVARGWRPPAMADAHADDPSRRRATAVASARPSSGTPAPPRAEDQAQALLEQARCQAEAVRTAAVREAEELRARAEAEGWRAGYAEGCRRATAEGERRLRAAARTLARARRERAAILAALDREVADLAMTVARQVIGRELDLAPEHVVELARRLLRRTEGPALLRVHPADLPLLEAERLPGVQLKADPSVGPGGLRLEAEDGMLDATVDGMLGRMADALADRVGGRRGA